MSVVEYWEIMFVEDNLLPPRILRVVSPSLGKWLSVTMMTSSRNYNEEVFGEVNELTDDYDVREGSGQLIVGDGVCRTKHLCLGSHP